MSEREKKKGIAYKIFFAHANALMRAYVYVCNAYSVYYTSMLRVCDVPCRGGGRQDLGNNFIDVE